MARRVDIRFKARVVDVLDIADSVQLRDRHLETPYLVKALVASANPNPAPGMSARQPPPRSAKTQPPQRRPPPTRRELEKRRVEEAAKFRAYSLSITWQDTVADRICAVTTWECLKRSRRRRNCKVLARLAAAVLKGKLTDEAATPAAKACI